MSAFKAGFRPLSQELLSEYLLILVPAIENHTFCGLGQRNTARSRISACQEDHVRSMVHWKGLELFLEMPFVEEKITKESFKKKYFFEISHSKQT